MDRRVLRARLGGGNRKAPARRPAVVATNAASNRESRPRARLRKSNSARHLPQQRRASWHPSNSRVGAVDTRLRRDGKQSSSMRQLPSRGLSSEPPAARRRCSADASTNAKQPRASLQRQASKRNNADGQQEKRPAANNGDARHRRGNRSERNRSNSLHKAAFTRVQKKASVRLPGEPVPSRDPFPLKNSNRQSRLKDCLQELCKQSSLLKDQVMDYDSLGSLAGSDCDPKEIENLLKAYKNEFQNILPSLSERMGTVQRRINALRVELGQYSSFQDNIQSNFEIIGKKMPSLSKRYNKENWRHWSGERLGEWICSIDGGHFEPQREMLLANIAEQGVKGEHLASLDINALLGLGISKFEDRLKLVNAITSLTSVEPDHKKHVSVPNEFKCPITMGVMRDPVICADGHTYERAALIQWFRTHDTSPKTGAIVESKTLIRNYGLRALINDFLEKHNMDYG